MKKIVSYIFHVLFLLFLTCLLSNQKSLAASTNCPDDYFYCVLGDGCCPCDEPKHPMCLACLQASGGKVANGECQPKEELVCPAGSEIIPGDGSVDCATPLFCDDSDCCCECEPGSYDSGNNTCTPCGNSTVSAGREMECHAGCTYGTGLNGYGKYSFKNENYYYRSGSNDNDCLNCIMGLYNPGDSLYCSLCPTPHYGTLGGECLQCAFGRLSYYSEGRDLNTYQPCEAYGFALPPNITAIIMGILGVVALLPLLLLFCRQGLKPAFGMFVYMILPSANAIFNFAYLLECYFVKPETLSLPFIPPLIVFGFILWVYRAMPCFIICPVPSSWYEEDYDSLMKLWPHVLVFFINLPIYALWLLLGVWLYITKAFAIGAVSSLWFRVWVGNSRLSSPFVIDVQLLNFILSCQILFEAFPMLVMQLCDRTLLVHSASSDWSFYRYAAVVLGVLSSLSGLYRILYFKIYKHVDLMDIPLSSRLSSLHLFTGHADELRSNPYSHLPSRGAVDDDEDRNGIISNESNRVQGDEGSDKEHGQEQFKRLLILRLHESCTSCFRCCRGSIDIFTALIRSISAEFTHDESNIELNRRRVSRNTAHSDESSEAHLEPSDDDRNADSALIAAYEEDMRIMKDELNQLRDDFVRAREEDKERARLEKDQAVAATAAAAMAAARNISQKPASSNNWF